jgi:hypothetical protein
MSQLVVERRERVEEEKVEGEKAKVEGKGVEGKGVEGDNCIYINFNINIINN